VRSVTPSDRSAAGFGLLEAVVALAILGLALSVLLPLLSSQLAAAGRVKDQHRALLLAESKLAELILPANLVPGAVGGLLPGGYVWQADVVPLDEGRRLRPFRVTLSVGPAQAADLVRLSTIALAPGR
jgi:general secretion pathway protein I